MKKFLVLAALTAGLTFTGCTDASIASHNLSKAADKFEIDRRIVFYNGITGEYILSLRGKCSIQVDTQDNQLEVTCKTGPESFKKHYLGISDNVTYFAEQMSGSNVSRYHYEVTFKPQAIIPDVDFRGSTDAIVDVVTPDKKD